MCEHGLYSNCIRCAEQTYDELLEYVEYLETELTKRDKGWRIADFVMEVDNEVRPI
jgi:hypothetical protein